MVDTADLNEPLAKFWKINDDEIPKYLDIENKLIDANKKLIPLLNSSSFGGTFINAKTSTIHIFTVDDSKILDILFAPDMQSYIDYFTFDTVLNSLDKLNILFNQIIESAKQFKPLNVLMFIDVEINNVTLYLNTDLRVNIPFINDIKKYKPNIQKREPRTAAINDVILSGEGIIGYNKSCSAGYWAKTIRKPNDDYLVTAGHCVQDFFFISPWNTKNKTEFIGPVLHHSTDPYDFAVINITNQDIIPRAVIRNTDVSEYAGLIIKRFNPTINSGVHICKSGHTTHLTCGYTRGFNGIYIHEKGTVKNLLFSDGITMRGDSGGAVFRYFQLNMVSLIGVVSVGAKGVSGFTLVEDIYSQSGLIPVVN
ncbi:6953_t:CDS:2 [Cetraspora pellucida]|uniref:6953_t:CDS:1 n=1 Tax=Cetraspora pellucida TaxID=1433469 RepID=A0ACA9JZR3_9GLOM|nr:6953_t:CDS:2 [Cetraspora pellucida]